MITTPNDIYDFVDLAMQKCREHGYDAVAQQLDDDMHLGSSGLEILGAIKDTLIAQAATFELFLDKAKLQEVIRYVDKVYKTE
jgi:hypothetical protein